ncbi:hypothetical protein [Rheinheimera sp.]|uniref:hypothetical protein n=1 Tax=Rheinheimera sp. TaxID=1869214 RepID=UPI003D26FD2B
MNTKWVKFICNSNAQIFSESLLKFPITQNELFGFDVHSFNEEMSHCSYFEKVTETLSYTLPSGELIKYEVVKIVSFEFKVFFACNESILLCVYEPSKSLKSFIKNLTDSLRKQIFISNATMDIIRFYNFVKSSKLFSDFCVSEITVSNLMFDENNSGELTVKSRMNALAVLEQRFRETGYTCKVMKFTFFHYGNKCQIKISKTGSIEFSGDIDDFLPKFILETLNHR